VRVISAKKDTLQALCIPKNVVWNALTFLLEKIGKPVDSASYTSVNQRIGPCRLGVALRNCPKSFELVERISPLV
jgi:hypothetical protein